jgi:L-2-hydroxyglutarate oxidase LhgO
MADILIIGGGIIGICIAREVKQKYPDAWIQVLEKESECAMHASGRNSGILHAGFYYSKDSLKARFTAEGNRLMTQYCLEKGLPINRCGKLVVAKNADELRILDELYDRGLANQVPLQMITDREARMIEPRVKTFRKALFSPTTASINPVEVALSMKRDAMEEGIEFHTDTAFLRKDGDRIITTNGKFTANFIINCAGLQADEIALRFGFSNDYRIMPFRGLYVYSDEKPGSLRTNIYPVPDIRNPFLGVHFTVAVNGHVKIGPTAMPVLWREQYSGLSNFNLVDFAQISMRELGFFISSEFDFKKIAFQELSKSSKKKLVELASELVSGVEEEHYSRWGQPGIRAQLVNTREKKLVMDFVVEGDEHSLHVLNAVSPGFTCAIPFAKYVAQRVPNP